MHQNAGQFLQYQFYYSLSNIMSHSETTLSPQLINKAPYYYNHSQEREIDLRSQNITAITHLNATMNFFQAIDLSNNLITSLQNKHYLDRLKTLVLSNNKITSISPLGDTLPNLQNLYLMGNRIKTMVQVWKLATCTHLDTLILNMNPVTEVEGYRKKVVGRLRALKWLDFKKVTLGERKGDGKVMEGLSGRISDFQ